MTGETNNTNSNTFTADDRNSHTITNQRIANTQQIKSDTPQAILSVADIENNLYASEATFNKDNISDNGTDVGTVTQEHTDNGTSKSEINNTNTTSSKSQYTNNIDRTETTERDYNMLQSEMLLKYRETFINIDKMIIEELKPLFMTVF